MQGRKFIWMNDPEHDSQTPVDFGSGSLVCRSLPFTYKTKEALAMEQMLAERSPTLRTTMWGRRRRREEGEGGRRREEMGGEGSHRCFAVSHWCYCTLASVDGVRWWNEEERCVDWYVTSVARGKWSGWAHMLGYAASALLHLL
jgi:hypothetical protein